MTRFYGGYDWAEAVTTLDGEAVTHLTKLAGARTVTFALNKPAQATGRVPSGDPRVNLELIEPGLDAPFLSFNDRLLYMFRREEGATTWVCRFAGIVMQIEDAAQADQPYSTFTAFDPWQYLFARPVMNGTALIGPDGLSWTQTPGNRIAWRIMNATIGLHGPVHIEIPDDEDEWDVTTAIDFNIQQGTSVGQALQQLCATGTLDIIMTPVYDPVGSPGVCCTMDVYTQAGQQRDGAVFSWGVGRTVEGISSLLDGDKMANTVQFYAGQGGPAVVPATDATSEARYGHWEVQQFFPAQNEAQATAVEAMAEFQLALRKNGKRTIRLQPSSLLSPIPLLEYGLGDRVPVWATNRLRQPIPWATDSTNYSRVYGIPIALSDDGVETVGGLVLSPDGF